MLLHITVLVLGVGVKFDNQKTFKVFLKISASISSLKCKIAIAQYPFN